MNTSQSFEISYFSGCSMGKGGQSITSVAAKTHLTPTALMVFNGLKKSALKQDMTLHLPEIKQVVVSPGKT